MSPHNYEIEALREALKSSTASLSMSPEQISAMAEEMAIALREQHLRLTDDGTTPSIDG